MNSHYDPKLEINYLLKIALQNYAGARLLWNLGLVFPSLQLLQESIEKHLKVLWTLNNTFTDENDLHNRLKKFQHNFQAVFNQLKLAQKQQLQKVMDTHGIKLYDIEGLKYGMNMPGLIYNDTWFKGGELLIKEIRKMIGIPIRRSIFENIMDAIGFSGYPQGFKKEGMVKNILSLKLFKPTKKQEIKKITDLFTKGK